MTAELHQELPWQLHLDSVRTTRRGPYVYPGLWLLLKVKEPFLVLPGGGRVLDHT